MDPITDLRIPESSETQSTEESSPQQLAIVAFASLSLSLSKILPINFFTTQPKTSVLFSSAPNKGLSLAATSSLSPPNFSFKSTISANPLHGPLSLSTLADLQTRQMPPEFVEPPSFGFAMTFVHHVECLNNANDESMSILPVYCFWGSALYHLDDLPFKLEDMPSHYGSFRKKSTEHGDKKDN